MKRKKLVILGLILGVTITISAGCGAGNDSAKKENNSGYSATKEIKNLKGNQLSNKIYEYLSKGDLKKAAAFGEEAVKKEPNNINALTNLSIVYMYQKDYSKMVQIMEKGKKVAPNNPVVLNQLAWSLIESEKNVAEGVKIAQSTLKYFNRPDLQKKSAPYYDTYAYGLYKLGKYDEALKIWEKILPQVQSGEVYVNVGKAFEAKKNYDRASDAYLKGLSYLDFDIKDANNLDVERARLQGIQKEVNAKLSKLKTGTKA